MNIAIIIAFGVFFALFVLNVIVDTFEILINFISLTAIGVVLQVINFVLDFIVGVVTNVALFFLGGKFIARRLIIQTTGQLAEFIPGIDILPIRTLTLLVNMILYFFQENVKAKQEESIELASGLPEPSIENNLQEDKKEEIFLD